MAFREVSVVEVREVLRLWLLGHGKREVARLAGVDRKTVSRYVAAAEAAGCDPASGIEQLCDELLGAVISGARPVRPAGHGSTRELLENNRVFLAAKVTEDLQLTKISTLFTRHTGVVVPYATLRRFAVRQPRDR